MGQKSVQVFLLSTQITMYCSPNEGDFTYTDWFYGYPPERKEISNEH